MDRHTNATATAWEVAHQRIDIDGAELDIRQRGSGQPVVFVHGGMGDECAAVVEEPALVEHFQVVDYHRRGWGNSSPVDGPVSIARQAADCRAVLRHLGVERAHFVGQSAGGVIVLQLALDIPEAVQSLALLEPGLPSVLFNSPEFSALAERIVTLYMSGDKAGAIAAFAREVGGDNIRAVFDRTLPPGAYQRWVEAADTLFGCELPSLQAWTFTREDAAHITQPVLNVVGADTRDYFRECHHTIRAWLPQAENVELPDATHAMLQTNPVGAAEHLAGFFSRHPIQKD